ncbi:alkaline phosphatase family protein [Nocardioides sp.]|uniref:alkaline phosphatase family protein n=1 Tax=Nocardioides sp. TaxID=35761 RepID=UPI003783DD8D
MTPRRTTLVAALAVVAAVVGLTACDGRPAATASARPASAVARSTDAAPTPDVTKLLVFVVENHSLTQMRRGMPWVSRLADRYGYATRYRAITHPSLPNYLAIAGGSTFGVTDDDPPAVHPVHRPSIFGEAVAAGSTAAVYAEGMTTPCRTTDTGRYAVRHNPWTYFPDERRTCRRFDGSLDRLAPAVDAGTLPAVGLVVPDVCHDAHDCSLASANAWLKAQVGAVLRGPDFASGRLAVVITADEDDRHHGNRVLTVVAHQGLDHQVVSAPLNHYSLSRSLADVAGVAPLAHARSAASLLQAFGLTT